MGRISKRGSPLQKETERMAEKHVKRYKAGIYARLSSEQGYKSCPQVKNESIAVQIEIAKKFVEEFNQEKTGEIIDVVECYTDLGKTGSNFEREGFQRLLRDIRLGDIDCVIVKDLSRFGRNYLEAGNYIEKIFPFLGVRFIAVADGYDTGKEGNENEQLSNAVALEIKNLVNDMYARDVSKKAKIHLKQRREEGSYVGGPPPYGYRTAWKDKRRVLIPDDKTADIVRFIYQKFAETKKYTAVCDELNKRRINPPAVYKKTGHVYDSPETYAFLEQKEYKGWDKSSVERILKNNTYLGALVQGKTSITARDEKNRIHKPQNEWIVAENVHKPLIDAELYQETAEIREKIRQKAAAHRQLTEGCPIEENIFDRVLYCGMCGRKMTRKSYVKIYAAGKKERLDSYFCLNGGPTRAVVCPTSNRISGKKLVELLFLDMEKIFHIFLEKQEKYMEIGRKQVLAAVRNTEEALRKTEIKKRRMCEEESSVYMEYRAGKISQKDYAAYQRKHKDKLLEFGKEEERKRKEIKALKKQTEEYLAAIEAFLKLKADGELTKEMTETFISEIYVYAGKRIEVLFTFTADGMEGVR